MTNLFNRFSTELVTAVLERAFRHHISTVHGVKHWQDVWHYAEQIAENDPSVDIDVVAHFCLLHDSCRFDDNDDPGHGPRAAEFVNELHIDGLLTGLNINQRKKLRYAIRNHSIGLVTEDPTVGVCWDADRLDLPRVGVTPIAILMSTKVGKEVARAMAEEAEV